MFRSVFLAAARSGSRSFTRRPIALIRLPPSQTLQSSRVFAPAISLKAIRCYASGPAVLSKEEITGRILDLLKNFDKVTDITKLSESAHFGNDLGLDSLDTVEVVMAIEEEFGIEIPDKDADAIHSVEQAISYVVSQPDAH